MMHTLSAQTIKAPRFSGLGDETSTREQMAEGQIALSHSRSVRNYVGSDCSYLKAKENAKQEKGAIFSKLKASFLSKEFFWACIAGIASTAGAILGTNHYMNTQTISQGREVEQLNSVEREQYINQMELLIAYRIVGSIGAVGTLALLVCSNVYGNTSQAIGHFKKMRKELQAARQLQAKSIPLTAEKDPLNLRFVNILNAGIQETAQRFAKKISDGVRGNSELRTYYQQVFLLDSSLPSAQDIAQLFAYYAYLKLGAEMKHKPAKEISELEFRKAVYTMMQLAAKTGELFDFVEPARPGDEKLRQSLYSEQQFSTAMQDHFDAMSIQVEVQMDLIRELTQREGDLAQYIVTGQKVLAALSLREPTPTREIQDVQQVLSECRERKNLLQESLKFNDGKMKLDDIQLTEMKLSLESLMDRFRSTVSLEKLLHELNADQGQDLALKRQLEAALNSPPTNSLKVASS